MSRPDPGSSGATRRSASPDGEEDAAPPLPQGAVLLDGGRCRFSVWAPHHEQVELHLLEPQEQRVALTPGPRGLHQAVVEEVQPGSLYLYRLGDGTERPDPASRLQPRGVHGPSAVVDPAHPWSDGGFRIPPLSALVLYEIHVGTFTPEGTFDAAVAHLEDLRELGVTAVEIMPVSPFPGTRNWGYDGVFPYAVQESYGGPAGLRRFVDACHRQELAVVLDVVYNHLGPEGNYLECYAPYFTNRYRTPWGASLNFDGAWSDEVRRFFIGSALAFLADCHIDAFRLDAIHAIIDTSARPFLQELAAAVHDGAEAIGRRVLVIAESDLNDTRVIRRVADGGYGLDAQWSDDFHHAVHALLTGERSGYYQDFGGVEDLAQALRQGFVYDGRFSRFRNRRHGNTTHGCPGERFIISIQNHDQVGNRARGERLGALLSFEELKLAACALLLAPYVPLLFMGEEYGETAPFQYFTSHADPELAEAVRRGRRREFTGFGWREEEILDPQDATTFERSRLDRGLLRRPRHRALRDLYRELLRLRRERPALRALDRERCEVTHGLTGDDEGRTLLLRRAPEGDDQAVIVLACGGADATVTLPLERGRWQVLLDSRETRFGGSGSGLPPQIESDGGASCTVGAKSCVVLVPARGGA
jgi:maltooligosyltrehalose trehalohydrolase